MYRHLQLQEEYLTSEAPGQPPLAWNGKGVLCTFAVGPAEPASRLLLPALEEAALQQEQKKPRVGELRG